MSRMWQILKEALIQELARDQQEQMREAAAAVVAINLTTAVVMA